MPSKLLKKGRILKKAGGFLKKRPSVVREKAPVVEKKEAPIRMNKKEQELIRKRLLDKKEAIVSKLSRTVAESKEVETDIARDVADKAESSYTKEFLLSLSDSDRDQLLNIDRALRSLDKGNYGVCQLCGRPITKKRLEALPWSIHCLECQQKIESGGEMESEA